MAGDTGASNITSVGYFHTSTVAAIGSGTFTNATALSFDQNHGSGRITVMRIPQYRNVTINAELTASAFSSGDGKGGYLVFRAQGDVNLGSTTITMRGKGYAGGGMNNGSAHAGQGESIYYSGTTTASNYSGGGGAGMSHPAHGGAGGGHGGLGQNGSGTTIGVAGGTLGLDTIGSMIYMGGGGGGANNVDTGGCSGMGAPGGGVVMITAKSIRGGSIDVRGEFYDFDRVWALTGRWGGGPGAGGTAWLKAADIINVSIDANGGRRGAACSGGNRPGGAGGGRIRLDAARKMGVTATVSGDSVNAGTIFNGGGGAFVESLIANSATDGSASSSLLPPVAVSSNLQNYFNASREVVVRIESTNAANGARNSAVHTDAVQLWYTRP